MPTSTSTTAAVTKGGGPSLWHRHCPRAWLWAWPPFPCPPPAWPQPRRLIGSPRPAAQAAHPPHRARHGRASLLQEEEAHTLTLTLTPHRSPLTLTLTLFRKRKRKREKERKEKEKAKKSD